MGHNPVNHPLRPVYRAIGGLTGLYFVVFGVVGLIVTAGDGLFSTTTDRVLGQGSNLASSILHLVLGAVVLVATVMGRNLDVAVDKYLGWAVLVIGSYSLAVIRTDANFLNYSVSTVIVTYLSGLFLIMTSYYSKVVSEDEAGEPRQVRERQAA